MRQADREGRRAAVCACFEPRLPVASAARSSQSSSSETSTPRTWTLGRSFWLQRDGVRVYDLAEQGRELCRNDKHRIHSAPLPRSARRAW